MIDYAEIIEQLEDNKVKNMLETFNIPYEDKGNYLIMPTVCHHASVDDASWKLYYYKNTHIFQCYTEEGAMSIFTFLKNYYETRSIVYDWYNDIYEVVRGCSHFSSEKIATNAYRAVRDRYKPQKDRRELPAYPEGILNIFTKYYPIEWLNDGISKAAMDKYNIRFSPTQNKIIIPHYDAAGRLVGIRGRALNQWEVENVGKYMPVQIENKWYSHPLSLNLYGLNFNKDEIKKYGIAYIFESEKSCLQFESFNLPHCAVASCGSNVNKYQIDLLMRYCQPREIVICYDNEELEGEDKYFQKLWKMCEKYKNYCNMSFIYDRKGLSKLKDSPSDNGEEIFIKLLKERIKI